MSLFNRLRQEKTLIIIIDLNGQITTILSLFTLFSYLFSFTQMRLYMLFHCSSSKVFFSRFRLFVFFLFFIPRWNPTKEHCYVKRFSTLFGALFRCRFSSRLYPILPLTPILSISILLLHPFPAFSQSLSLPLLTVSSNPVSSKLCRILVRR